MTAALPIAAVAALALAAQLRRGSRSGGSADTLRLVKDEAKRLASVMMKERDKSLRRDRDLAGFELNEQILVGMCRTFPAHDFVAGNDRIVARSRVDPRFMIKLAPTSAANLDEAAAYQGAGPRTRACLVPVLAHHKGGDWLIMEYARPASVNGSSPWPDTPCSRHLKGLGFVDLHDDNLSEDGRALDYGEPVQTKGSAARRPAARPRPCPLTDEERLDALGLAAEDGMVSFSGGCGAVALAMREVLFDGEAEVVAAVNRHLWRQGWPVGHVGVRDRNGVVWDGEGTYEGDAIEEFLAWGAVDPGDPDYELDDEAQAFDVVLLDGPDALRAAQAMPCPARAPDPRKLLLAARMAVERRRGR